IAGAEVGMTTFSGKRMMRAPIPTHSRVAQPRSGGNDGRIARRVCSARVERHEVRGLQGADAIGGGLEVVDHPDTGNAELPGQSDGVYYPGKVGGYAPSVVDGSGDAERS